MVYNSGYITVAICGAGSAEKNPLIYIVAELERMTARNENDI